MPTYYVLIDSGDKGTYSEYMIPLIALAPEHEAEVLLTEIPGSGSKFATISAKQSIYYDLIMNGILPHADISEVLGTFVINSYMNRNY